MTSNLKILKALIWLIIVFLLSGIFQIGAHFDGVREDRGIPVLLTKTGSVRDPRIYPDNETSLSDAGHADTRYGNTYVENFKNLDKIDISNTTCTINLNKKRITFETSKKHNPTYVGTMSMNTHSHGGGFSPIHNEYWYPHWAGSTVYRYDRNQKQLGSFNLGQRHIMQLWSDIDGTFYGAHWGYDVIKKWTVDKNNNWKTREIWSYHMGSTAGSVTVDDKYVYAMRWYDSNIQVLDKSNGRYVRSFNIGATTYDYGTLAYANGVLYVGGYNRDRRRVAMINPANGNYLGDFRTNRNIYNMAFNGEEYCVSDNGYSVSRYKISDGNAYFALKVDPTSKTRYVQSKPIYSGQWTLGAVRLNVSDNTPDGTEIVYNVTADGEHWETVEPGTNHVFEHQGAMLLWNATLKAENVENGPTIDRIGIEYDLVDDPEPSAPASAPWQGTQTPTLKWNFTDPDKGDHQSDFVLEVYSDPEMEDKTYDTSWINSTITEHAISKPLADGIYFWRVRTKDAYHAASNYSILKKFKIDTTKPFGNITIAEDLKKRNSVNEELVPLEILAEDNSSGVADMQIIDDRGSAREWESFKEKKQLTLAETDGLKKVGVRFRDNAGIVSDIFYDTVYLDLKGPGDIAVTSPTHPDVERYFKGTTPVFRWEAPYEVTEIKGYSYIVNTAPAAEPYKDASNPKSPALTETASGEFSGLGEGTWYFHITSCDIYNQWGNTTHFKFNIDSLPPVVKDITPGPEWTSDHFVRSSVVFEDIEGFGLDLDTLRYAYKMHGESDFSSWTGKDMEVEVLEKGLSDNPSKIRASVKLELPEGDGNAVKWRVTDIPGNGPVESVENNIRIDTSPVAFSDPVPAGEEVNNDNMVSCGIRITDEGSGVDGSTIEYSVSGRGKEEKHFKRWTKLGNNKVETTMDVLALIEFDPGKENYIRWRGADAAGNGPALSEPFRVWVNSPPVPKIAKPEDEASFYTDETVNLSAAGTEDNEGDELTYYWVIKNRSNNRIFLREKGEERSVLVDSPGIYVVYLHVDDGYGFNESRRTDVNILKRPEKPGDDDEDEVEEIPEETESFVKTHLRTLIGAGVGLLLLIIVLFIVVRKRRIGAEPERVEPTGRYSQGFGMDYYRPAQAYSLPQFSTSAPQFSTSAPPYSSPGAAGPGDPGGVGSWGQASTGPQDQVLYREDPRNALPQGGAASQTGQTFGRDTPSQAGQTIGRTPSSQPGGTPAAAYSQIGQTPSQEAAPALPQSASASPSVTRGAGAGTDQMHVGTETPAAGSTTPVPQYSLPSIVTPQGNQDLNVAALPPAPMTPATSGAAPPTSTGEAGPGPHNGPGAEAEYLPPDAGIPEQEGGSHTGSPVPSSGEPRVVDVEDTSEFPETPLRNVPPEEQRPNASTPPTPVPDEEAGVPTIQLPPPASSEDPHPGGPPGIPRGDISDADHHGAPTEAAPISSTAGTTPEPKPTSPDPTAPSPDDTPISSVAESTLEPAPAEPSPHSPGPTPPGIYPSSEGRSRPTVEEIAAPADAPATDSPKPPKPPEPSKPEEEKKDVKDVLEDIFTRRKN